MDWSRKAGLEKFFDNELRGKFGRKRNEVTSEACLHHKFMANIGNDIQTSLDMGQAFAIERFEKGNNTGSTKTKMSKTNWKIKILISHKKITFIKTRKIEL